MTETADVETQDMDLTALYDDALGGAQIVEQVYPVPSDSAPRNAEATMELTSLYDGLATTTKSIVVRTVHPSTAASMCESMAATKQKHQALASLAVTGGSLVADSTMQLALPLAKGQSGKIAQRLHELLDDFNLQTEPTIASLTQRQFLKGPSQYPLARCSFKNHVLSQKDTVRAAFGVEADRLTRFLEAVKKEGQTYTACQQKCLQLLKHVSNMRAKEIRRVSLSMNISLPYDPHDSMQCFMRRNDYPQFASLPQIKYSDLRHVCFGYDYDVPGEKPGSSYNLILCMLRLPLSVGELAGRMSGKRAALTTDLELVFPHIFGRTFAMFLLKEILLRRIIDDYAASERRLFSDALMDQVSRCAEETVLEPELRYCNVLRFCGMTYARLNELCESASHAHTLKLTGITLKDIETIHQRLLFTMASLKSTIFGRQDCNISNCLFRVGFSAGQAMAQCCNCAEIASADACPEGDAEPGHKKAPKKFFFTILKNDKEVAKFNIAEVAL